MVDQTALNRRIEVRLTALRSRLDALSSYDAPGGDRAALEAEWRDALDRFSWLHERFMSDALTRDQATRHRRNLALLAEHITRLHQLGLAVPNGALADWFTTHPV